MKKIIYLDHAASTPLDSRVKKVMAPFFSGKFGNPSSLHQKGREAKVAIESARQTISELINAKPSEIIFTAGGTESVNLAVLGTAHMSANWKTDKHGLPPHLITSTIEHHCVLNSFKALTGEGCQTDLIDVDGQGFVNFDKLKKSIRPETVLISVMYANNEVGTIEPIAEIGKWLKQINTERFQNGLTRILFHTDACQAAGFLELDVNQLGVDLMSVNGSKIYGPKQTGFLYVRSGVNIYPLIFGGGQEKGMRSGTENVANIVGLAKALELVQNDRELESKRISGLTEYLVKGIRQKVSEVLLNGPDSFSLKAGRINTGIKKEYHNKLTRLPNNTNFSFKDVEGEALMLYLDSYGIMVSTGSACSTAETEASHVLTAIGLSQAQARSSIRLTLGKQTTKIELDSLLKVLPGLVKQLRKVKNIV